ncbi:sodium/potassium-transporting ATPase subunit beta-2-like [Athalia rosae]|uniref:sodium/potassium-transporting ATPase subunit beta-2-like n=1 Tax=Athalia rosae TaxID=37344 RepID=UPI00203430AD|nr:sodium/potassium-transporting ATPase subunit beta-2-like [Athalia rosae]
MACTVRGKPVVIHPAFYAAGIILVAVIGFLIFYHVDPRVHYAIFGASDDTNIVNGIPGLSVRPRITEAGKSETLIMYNSRDKNSYMRWVDALDDFLKEYKNPWLSHGRMENIHNCDFRYPPPPGAVCEIDPRAFGPCISENHYNFHRSAPCIFIKLNTPTGWIPAYYNESKSLPEVMPGYLRSMITAQESSRPDQLNTVWLSCEGEMPADAENIGPIRFLPIAGFPGYYTKNVDVAGYLPPIVAVMFERPTLGVLINVECKAWAKNIQHDRDRLMGVVHFELLID